MKSNRWLVALGALVATAQMAVGVNTNTWEFDFPDDYVYDAQLVEVSNSQARLVLQATAINDAEFAEYTNAAAISALTFDEHTHVQLNGLPGTFPSNGVFTSRILDGGEINHWDQLVVAASFSDYVSDPDVLNYYRFDNDLWLEQVSGLRATVFSTPLFIGDAKVGSHSALFRGAPIGTGYIRAPGNNPLFGASQFTVAFWYKLVSYTEFGGLYSGFSTVAPNPQFRIRQRQVANRVMEIRITTTAGLLAQNWPVATNEWHYVVVTWDGDSLTDKRATIYVDGVIEQFSGDVGGTINYAGQMYVGNDMEQLAQRASNIYMDDLLVMRRALTFDEVTQLTEGRSAIFQPLKVSVRSGNDIPELEGRNFVGPNATTSTTYYVGTSDFGIGPEFNADDRYVQYQAQLASDRSQTQTPMLRGVAFLGAGASVRDTTFAEFGQGTLTSNLMLNPPTLATPFLGLAKRPNGGYFTNGVFESGPIDAGVLSQWDQIKWTLAPEMPNTILGMVGLWRFTRNWFDAKGSFSVFSPPQAQYSSFAKAGESSALFTNGNSVTISGAMGQIRTIEFWIQDHNLHDEIMAMSAAHAITISNRQIQVLGVPRDEMNVIVNGIAGSPTLLPGWNHVALTMKNGLNMNSLVVGQVPGVGYMEGKLDELAIYDREISVGEASAHYVLGQREAAGRVKFQLTIDPAMTNFVGPGGSPTEYFETSPTTDGDQNLLGTIPAQRRLRYRAILEGEGDATPMVRSVRVSTSAPDTQRFLEDTAAEFYGGTRVAGQSQIYGGLMSFDNLHHIGPVNLSALTSPLAVGIWHFDDVDWVTGERPVRSSGAGGSGSAYGNARPSFDARVGRKAGLFDGNGDYIDSLSSTLQIDNNDFSFSLWFKTRSTLSAPLFTVNDPLQFAALWLKTDANTGVTGSVSFVVNDGSGERAVTALRTELNNNQWHHLVGVRSGSQLLLYLDGERQGALLAPGLGDCSGALTYMVAKQPATTNVYYAGLIDEIVVHRRALSEAEIGELFAGGGRTSVQGSFQSETFSRQEPSIWQTLSWVPMAPYCKPLSLAAVDSGSLVGLWHLDEASGIVSNTGAAAGLHGTVSGAQYRRPGRFAQALEFSGAGSVVVANNAALNPSPESLTIEAWVYLNEVDSRTILSKRSGGNGYALATDAQGRPLFLLGGTQVTGEIPLRVQKWTHLAGTYSGAKLRLYADGSLVAAGDLGSGSLASTADLVFGRSNAGSQYVSGRLDEIAIHKRVLNDEEVLDHYRAGSTTAKFQAHSSNTNTFSTPLVGPDGTTNTYFTLSSGADMTAAIPAGFYFEYRGIFESEDFRYPPELRGITVFVSGYPISNPTIHPTEEDGFRFPGHLLRFSDLRLANPNTDVRYQISGDEGLSPRWFYYDTANRLWVQEAGFGYPLETSTTAEISTNIVTFYTQVYNKTGGLFRFRAFLNSSGEQLAGIDRVRIEASEGRINVVTPDGIENGELSWLVGVPYSIVWDFTNVSGTVKLEYSVNAGNSWTPVTNAGAVPVGNRQQNWVTPNTVTTQALVRIENNQDATINDRSDRTFTLRHGMQITDHNGGTNIWYLGETNVIRWLKSSAAVSAHIEFSPDGVFTGNQVRITTSTVGPNVTNAFAWVTPFNNPSFVSENGRLCVTNPAPNPTRYGDVSDNTFLLAGAVVVSPVAGQGVKKDADFDLQWVSAGMGPQVRIEVQTEANGPWSLVADSAPNASGLNSFVWNPTNKPTGSARIRIQSLSDARAMGLSDVFNIAAVELVLPDGAEDQDFTQLWLQNTVTNILWTSGGASNFVNILYSVDGGSTYTPIVTNYPNLNSVVTTVTNSYAWTVAPFPTKTARIRIEDSFQPTNLFDVSAYNFKIAGLRVAYPDKATDFLEARVEGSITWDENDVGLDGTIQFSDNEGATWLTIAQGPLLGDHQFFFTPTNPTLKGLVRIIADNPAPFTNIVDVSNTNFPVRGVRIAAPQQAAGYTIGSTNPVTFVVAATFDADFRAQIFYAEDGVNFDRDNPLAASFSFVDGIANTFNWLVEPSRRPSQFARIRVEAGQYFAESDDFVLRGVKFDQPNAATVWAPGVRSNLWAAAGIADGATADIFLSLAGGAPGTFTNRIVQNVSVYDLTAPWTIPLGLGPSTNARLRFDIVSSPAGAVDTSYFADSEIFTLQGIRVLSPLGTDRWDLGSTQTITWDSASGGSRVDLLYSPDGGVTWDPTPIAANIASQNGTNSFSWVINYARTPGSNAIVRVASRSIPGLSGDSAPFYVRGIKINRPSGADIYASTDPINLIQWVAANNTPAPFTIRYVRDAQAPVQIVAGLAATNRVHNWAYPPLAAVSDNVRIEITDGVHTGTSAVFRIVNQPTIQVIAPAAGAFWEVGSTHELQWSRGGTVPNDFNVTFVLSPYDTTNAPLTTGGGITFDETNNLFRYTWQVPDNPGPGKIVVKHNTLTNVFDDSSEFSIVGKYEILNPPGPLDVYALRPNTLIRWRTRGSVPFVNLYYSLSETHEASSWVKINSAPIPNNNRPFDFGDVEGSWSVTTYDWTVPNARANGAAVRVQEAAYPQLFEPTDAAPFDDSGEFAINYYTIYWNVYDSVTGTNLDHVSIVDSSGWGVADASSIPPNVIVRDYPWGSFNTEIYREGFFDASILFWSSENLTLAPPPGPPSWTQHVAMVRSQITEEYHVLANFSYDPNQATNNSKVFTINAWMERGGVILASPTMCTVRIYNEVGDEIGTEVSSNALDTGVFWLRWDAAGYDDGSVFFAKVEITYSGQIYSSGLTFTLIVPISDAIREPLENLTAAISNNVLGPLVGALTNVAGISDALNNLQSANAAGFSNLTDLARATTNMLGEVQADVKTLTNEVISVLGPKVDALTNQVTTLGVASSARILTRPEAVATGSINRLLYKSQPGYPDGSVAISVVNLDGGFSPTLPGLDQVPGISGLYQTEYTANWGIGRYQITVSDPSPSTASDSIVMRIVSGDIYEMPLQLSAVSNKLDTIELQLIGMSKATDAITNDLLPMVLILSTNLSSLATNIGIDFAYIQQQVGYLTNGLATLNDLDKIAENVATLTNALSSITNVPQLVNQLTNALGDFSAQDIADLNRGMTQLTNTFGAWDRSSVTALDNNVTRMANAMFAVDGMVFDLNAVTGALWTVDLRQMQSNVSFTARAITNLDFSGIEGQIGILSNSLNQIAALTNLAPTINALGTNLLPVNFRAMEANVTNMVGILGALDGLDEIAVQIGQLSNSLSQISAVTNLSGSMNLLTNALVGVNFRTMEANVTNILNTVGALSGLEALTEALNGVSNSLVALSGIGNMSNQVNAIYTNISAGNLGYVTRTLGELTNRMYSVPGQVLLLSNQMATVARGVGDVTNRLAPFDWGVITNIQSLAAQTYTNVQAIDNLQEVASDLQALTNSIAQLSGITNLGAQVSGITNALNGLNWADVLYIKTNVAIITNQLTGIGAINSSVAALTNSVDRLVTLTNMSGQVSAIATAVGGIDFQDLTNDVKSILAQVNQINWNDIAAVRADLQYTTNVLAGMNDLPALIAAIYSITNATADLQQLGSFSTQLNAIAGAVVGVNFQRMYNDVASVTQTLAGAQLSLLPGMNSTLNSISNLLENANFSDITNFSSVVGELTTNLSAINWADISELKTEMDSVTNSLTELTQLQGIIDALNGLSNALPALAEVTNIGSQVAQVTNAIAGITNAFDWSDITDIQTNVHGIMTRVISIDAGLAALSNLTSSIGNVGDLTNLQTQLSVLTNQLYGADWSDITRLQSDMTVVTNSLGGLGALLGLDAQIDTLIATVESVGTLTNTFASADWDDVTTINTTLNTLSDSLEGLNGVDLTEFDPTSNARIEGMLTQMATVNLVDELERLMGQITDTASDRTFFGRLTAMENQLTIVGVDAKNAAQRAQGAKTKAGDASDAINSLQSDIEDGNLLKVMERIREIQTSLQEAANELAMVPKDVDPNSLYAQVRSMADSVNKLATSKGFGNLLDFEGAGVGEGEGMDAAAAKDLNLKIQEVRDGMNFLKQLVDEMRYEPVVQGNLLGVE